MQAGGGKAATGDRGGDVAGARRVAGGEHARDRRRAERVGDGDPRAVGQLGRRDAEPARGRRSRAQQRHPVRGGGRAEDADLLVAVLPAVAVRAGEGGTAP